MKFLILALASCGTLASAQLCPSGPAVQTISCQAAQQFAAANQCYWTADSGASGNVPIYPVLQADQIQCSTGYQVAAYSESTLDQSSCVLGYFCNRVGK